MVIRIFQTYYNDVSKTVLLPSVIPYFNSTCTRYFEGKVMADLIQRGSHIGSDYFGVLGASACEKISKLAILLESIPQNTAFADFYCFKGKNQEQVWRQGHAYHGGFFLEVSTQVFEKLGYHLDLLQMKCERSYFNYHIARTPLYERFVNECLIPAMEIMENPDDKDLQAKLNTDANYERVTGALPMEKVKEIMGVNYYTLHPFILERLFPTFAALQGWVGVELDAAPFKDASCRDLPNLPAKT